MMNTQITDPEVFEEWDPYILREFSLRPGSRGEGLNRGGDGAVRGIEIRVPVQYSILSERRSRRPYELNGGGDGASGKNLIVKKDEERGEMAVNLGAKGTTRLGKGERVIIHSPGGALEVVGDLLRSEHK